MSIEITRMTEADIDGAVECIQKAFAEDPYNKWVFNDREKVNINQFTQTFLSISFLQRP